MSSTAYCSVLCKLLHNTSDLCHCNLALHTLNHFYSPDEHPPQSEQQSLPSLCRTFVEPLAGMVRHVLLAAAEAGAAGRRVFLRDRGGIHVAPQRRILLLDASGLIVRAWQ